MGKVVKKIFKTVATIAAIIPGPWHLPAIIALTGLSLLDQIKGNKPAEISPAALDRLYASIDPDTPRKIVFGETALATDIRDQEFTDSDAYLHRFLVVASHQVESIDEIWFDNEQAWTSGGGAQGDFAGYLTVATRTIGSAANAINISARMGDTRHFTGLAYVHLKYKLTGNSSSENSPFAQSIPSRVTIRGKAALVYDPRLDTTAGGDGAQRADDQTTWAYDPGGAASGRNPALQLLWYLLGWRIQNPVTSEWKLACGMGIPAARIDMASFIAAANICDETVALDGGGTEPRYRSDGAFSEADDPGQVIAALEASMNGRLRDYGGKLAVKLFADDLAAPVARFDDADLLGGFEWIEGPTLDEEFNEVRGRYVDASDEALYQPLDYPAVTIASPDGITRYSQFDLPTVQSASQAQRLAKQHLQRNLYRKTFAGEFKLTGLRCQKDDIVTVTLAALGWTDKLLRVVEQRVAQSSGRIAMILREEHEDIYAWDAEESPAVTPAVPSVFSRSNSPLLLSVAAAATSANWSGIVDDDDNKPDDNADVTATATPSIDGPSTMTIYRDYTGTVKSGQLPKTAQFVRKRGDTDVSSSATWETTQPGGYTTSIDSDGTLSVSAISPDQAQITVTATYGGVSLTKAINVLFADDAPPSGGGGGSSDSSSLIGPSTTSYEVISDVLEVTTVDSSVALTASATYAASNMVMKWQYSADGTTGWADVSGTETTGSPPFPGVPPYEPPSDGFCTSSGSKTGLSVGVSAFFRVMAKRTSGSGAMTLSTGSGSATA